MPQKSRPDPSNGTVVSADEYEGMMLGAAEDGIIGTPSDVPVVYADATGRQVKVRAGKMAMVRGYSWFSDPTTDEIINGGGAGLPANTSGNPRIDRLVLRLDRTTRQIRTVYLQGTPQITPSPPTLTQSTDITSSVWDFPLARWNVAAGYTTIAAADLTYEAWYRGISSGRVLCTSATRPFGAYLYPGLNIYEYDTTMLRTWKPSGWDGHYEKHIRLNTLQSIVTLDAIPKTLKWIRLQWSVRNDADGRMFMRINGDPNGNGRYLTQFWNAFTAGTGNGTDTTTGAVLLGSTLFGALPGAWGGGVVHINGWDAPHADFLTGTAHSGYIINNSGASHDSVSTWNYSGSSASGYSRIDILPGAGNMHPGSSFSLIGGE